jgi:type I restriction enzyme, R subunit
LSKLGYDPDKIEETARNQNKLGDKETPTEEQIKKAKGALLIQASETFTGNLNTYIENVRKTHEQVIDIINLDSLLYAGWDKEGKDGAREIVEDFKTYIEANRDEITALQILYNEPYRRKEITFAMIKSLYEKIKEEKPALSPMRVWLAYEHLEKVNGTRPEKELSALVSLIRRVIGIDKVLTPFDRTVDKNFQEWVFGKQAGALKYNEEQMQWLRMIKEHIAVSFHIEKEDFSLSPFDSKGGLGKMWKVFGEATDGLIDELNGALAA